MTQFVGKRYTQAQLDQAVKEGRKAEREKTLSDFERVARGDEVHVLTLADVKTWDEATVNRRWSEVSALLEGKDAA